MSKEEIWKDIVGYEGLYQISNLGNVKSFKHKKPIILNSAPQKTGYRIVQLVKNKKYKTHLIHRLVAEAFLDNPLQKMRVNIRLICQ